MSTHENELFKVINESENPEQAVLTAIDIILEYLMQPESFEARASAYLLAQA